MPIKNELLAVSKLHLFKNRGKRNPCVISIISRSIPSLAPSVSISFEKISQHTIYRANKDVPSTLHPIKLFVRLLYSTLKRDGLKTLREAYKLEPQDANVLLIFPHIQFAFIYSEVSLSRSNLRRNMSVRLFGNCL